MNNYFKFGLVAALLCSAGYLRAEEVTEHVIEEISVSIEDKIELSTIMAYELTLICALFDEDETFKSEVFMAGYDFYILNQDGLGVHDACSAYSEVEGENFIRGASTAADILSMVEENNPDYINKDAFRTGLINAFNSVPLPKISKRFSDHRVTKEYYETLKIKGNK